MDEETIRKLDKQLIREHDRLKMVEAEYDRLVRPALEAYTAMQEEFKAGQDKAIKKVLAVKEEILALYLAAGKYEVPVACHHIIVEKKTITVVDPTKVPDEFWKVDELKVKKMIQSGWAVSGVKVGFERSISVK